MKTLLALIILITVYGCSSVNKMSARSDSKGPEQGVAGEQQLQPAFMFVTIRSANVRGEPSVTADVVTQLRIGTKVKILAQKDDWFQVEYQPGKTGWCHRTALAVSDQK